MNFNLFSTVTSGKQFSSCNMNGGDSRPLMLAGSSLHKNLINGEWIGSSVRRTFQVTGELVLSAHDVLQALLT
jgi:hypothetical protein